MSPFNSARVAGVDGDLVVTERRPDALGVDGDSLARGKSCRRSRLEHHQHGSVLPEDQAASSRRWAVQDGGLVADTGQDLEGAVRVRIRVDQ